MARRIHRGALLLGRTFAQSDPFEERTALTARNIGDDGSTWVWSSIRESGIYYAPHNRTYITYEAWDVVLADRRVYFTWIDHATNTMGPRVDVGLTTLNNDNHGAPMMVIGPGAYIHIFAGSHFASTLKHASASLADPSSWTVRAAISGTLGAPAYPKAATVGNNIYLLYRATAVGVTPYCLKIGDASALDGTVSWGSEILVIEPEGTDGELVYAGNLIVVGTEIWFPWTIGASGDTSRYDIFFGKLITSGLGIKNFAGTTTVLQASFPLTRASADTNFKIFDHTAGREGIDIPVWDIDGSNNPYIFIGDGPTGGPYDVLMIRGAAGVLQAPEDTGINVGGQGSFARFTTIGPYRNSDGSIDLYYPPADGAFQLDGHVNVAFRAAGGGWSAGQRLLTAIDRPIGRFSPIRGGHSTAKMLMSELMVDGSGASSESDAFAPGHRGYVHGSGGFVGRTAQAPVNVVAPLISGNEFVGETLSVDDGAWTGHPSQFYMSFAKQWRNSGVDIPGETGDDYVVQASDEGDLISARVTPTSSAGSTPITTTDFGPIEAAPPSAPLDGIAGLTGAWSVSRQLLTSYGGVFYTFDGSNLSLKDQTGGGRHFQDNGTMTIGPAGPNNRDAIDQITGVINTFVASSNFISASAAYTIVACIIDAYPGSAQPLIGDGANFWAIQSLPGQQVRGYNWDGTGDLTAGVAGAAAGTPMVLELRHEGGTVYCRVNGSAEVSVASGNTQDVTGFFSFGSFSVTHEFFEAATFNVVPNLATRDALVANMKNHVGA